MSIVCFWSHLLALTQVASRYGGMEDVRIGIRGSASRGGVAPRGIAVLLDGIPIQDDTGHVYFNPDAGRLSLLFPQGSGRVRAYVSYHHGADPPRGFRAKTDGAVKGARRSATGASSRSTP